MKLTERTLRKLSKSHTDGEVGKMFGVSDAFIWVRRKKWGIPPRPRRKFDPPKNQLNKLYQKYSMAKIAEHYGVGETVVHARLKEHGISIKNHEKHGHRTKSRQFSDEHLANLRAACKKKRGRYRGENSPHWKGGVSGSSRSGRSIAEYKDWKKAVLDKYDYTCQDCGLRQELCKTCGHKPILHCHHIKDYRDNPKLRYAVSNGIALCKRCHHNRHM